LSSISWSHLKGFVIKLKHSPHSRGCKNLELMLGWWYSLRRKSRVQGQPRLHGESLVSKIKKLKLKRNEKKKKTKKTRDLSPSLEGCGLLRQPYCVSS
jgi:hypothetical protein